MNFLKERPEHLYEAEEDISKKVSDWKYYEYVRLVFELTFEFVYSDLKLNQIGIPESRPKSIGFEKVLETVFNSSLLFFCSYYIQRWQKWNYLEKSLYDFFMKNIVFRLLSSYFMPLTLTCLPQSSSLDFLIFFSSIVTVLKIALLGCMFPVCDFTQIEFPTDIFCSFIKKVL